MALTMLRDSTPPSDDASKVSSDENADYDNKSKPKEFNLNQCVSGFSSAAGTEGEKQQKRIKKEDGGFDTFYNNELGRNGYNNKRSSEGVLAPANWRRNGENQSSGQLGVNFDGSGNESKVKKVKLKVGGVTRTIHANSKTNGASGGGSSKGSQSSDDSRLRQKQNLQGSSDSPTDRRGGLQGIPWKDFSRGGFGLGKEDSLMGKSSGKNPPIKQEQSGLVRKSKRIPKKRVLDGEFEDEEDDEIRYLEKLKTSKVTPGYKEDDEESGKKQQKFSRVSNLESAGTSRSGKDGKKKSRSDRASENTDYEEEEGPVSDGEVGGKMQKKQKESVDSLMENKREITLTTRQRALQSSKDASSTPGSCLIEFPNGLPPAPSRKQKEKLSDVEQQLKKAEAAQRRRMQVEKANRESEAQAIRKILGQDSKREKRKEQIKKRLEELAQEKAANVLMLASNTIRWVSRPTGTVVTFPKDMGFPSLFDSKPCSYPPPRENCAGPSCTNPYKYRDSKSKLPLCSLQCYKAVQEKLQAETTC
ncbi:HIT zinc finger,PAPA-1-like conserved region isoform 1 [Melia azedarach]|uniref:HIT zinc finger,PAPA-1-like conserved region isoform 1 n=1 Tax=Melia azedarach TaxID=155640 RepID=A0ACC1YX89_MELAZ|nr:HIT zinc finger,PAPA-1-like conserved region isoform 1 [Melia azedarach]